MLFGTTCHAVKKKALIWCVLWESHILVRSCCSIKTPYSKYYFDFCTYEKISSQKHTWTVMYTWIQICVIECYILWRIRLILAELILSRSCQQHYLRFTGVCTVQYVSATYLCLWPNKPKTQEYRNSFVNSISWSHWQCSNLSTMTAFTFDIVWTVRHLAICM